MKKYFKANDFEPTPDRVWALKMSEYINSNHHGIINNSENLANALYSSVKASDLPGMADIDSSLYLFCREIRKDNTVALSGECADEIFGGYPWYRRPEDINADTFPWSKSINSRKEILSDELKSLDLEEYLNEQYKSSIKQVPHIDGESKLEYRMRELFYLNIKWFMITLLNRKDRMSMSNSLEVRVPFADYRLVEYAFNIPSDIKLTFTMSCYHAFLIRNLRRAAELIAVPDARLLEIYNAMRPYKSTKEELIAISDELKNQYNAPISASLLAEIFATCSIFSKSSPTSLACDLIFATTAATAKSMPLFKSIGFAPAVTFFRPSR